MLHELKEESIDQKAIRLLTYIAKEFRRNHESTVCFDKDITMDILEFLTDIEKEEKMLNNLKKLKTIWKY